MQSNWTETVKNENLISKEPQKGDEKWKMENRKRAGLRDTWSVWRKPKSVVLMIGAVDIPG